MTRLRDLAIVSTFALGLAAGAAGSALAEVPESKDTIKLAINEWTGQHITTYVAGEILTRMGYNVEYTTAGYLPQFEAMQDGTLTASLEIWSNNVGDAYAKAEETKKITKLGDLGLVAGEGWYYPAYVEAKCPGLPDWHALMKCTDVFGTPETFPDGRLLDYPLDWGARNVDIIKALKLPYQSQPGGSEGAMTAEMKADYAKQTPFLVMFWTPHWVFAQMDLKRVALPEYTDQCMSDPKWGDNPDATGDCFVPIPITFKVAWSGMKDKWPAATKFLEHFQFTADAQIPMIAAIDADGKDLKAVAAEWVDKNQAIWQPWVDAAKAGN